MKVPPSSPSIVISEDDHFDRLDDLLAADSPVMKVQCTEDDALDLDELLRKDDDDDSADETTHSPHKLSASPPPPSAPLAPLRPLPGGNIFNQGYQQAANNYVTTAATTQLSPLPSSTAAVTATEREKGQIISSSPSPVRIPPTAVEQDFTSTSPTLRSPILAREDDEDEEVVHWVLPPPAKPGDYLNTSIKKIPSKSILKKVSSYGNFDASSSSYNGSKSYKTKTRNSVTMDAEAIDASMGKKKPSFLNMSMGSASSNRSEISGSSYGVGLDLCESSSLLNSPRSQSIGICPVDENSVKMDSIPPMPLLTTDSADRAAGSASNSLDLSSSGKKMSRSVSFSSVDVREYARTVGDNPSCRSGPPLSLDWSYSKKYEEPKCLDQYEIERQDRARSLRQLHVTKHRRRNLLSFSWGHSDEEMKNARKETKKLQRQRDMTLMLLPIHRAHEAFLSVKGFVAKKRGKACPKEELQKITDELSKATEDTSHDGRPSTRFSTKSAP